MHSKFVSFVLYPDFWVERILKLILVLKIFSLYRVVPVIICLLTRPKRLKEFQVLTNHIRTVRAGTKKNKLNSRNEKKVHRSKDEPIKLAQYHCDILVDLNYVRYAEIQFEKFVKF